MAADPTVAVVIPYFQRKPGLLRAALASVMKQQVAADVRLIVVDDSSPVPADAELADIAEPWRSRIILKRIPNGGASHARNVALDSVPDPTDFVAFLDSDDRWRPEHLARALQAFAAGADFYFADFARHDWTTSAFSRCSTFHPEQHPPLDAGLGLFRFAGNFFEQILRNNPIGTSTVVYRFPRRRALRFDESLTISGEDILFWLGLVYENCQAVFSNQIECDYTAGVNICYDAKWGTEAGIEVSYNDLRMLDLVVGKFALSADLRQRLRQQRRGLTLVLLTQVFHRLSRGHLGSLRWLGKAFWHDWRSCAIALTEVLRGVAARWFGSPDVGAKPDVS